MKKKVIIIFLALLLIFLNFPQKANTTFNPKNVYNITNELTKQKYMGRLAGENGNILASNFIANYYKAIGLKPPFKHNSYYQSFNVFVPIYSGNFNFEIFDKRGKKIKEYKYGSDYKEITLGDVSPGTANGKAKIAINHRGNILLVKNGEVTESITAYEHDRALRKKGIKALIYETTNSMRFRSPYKLQIPNTDGLIKLMVTPKVFTELYSFSKKNYTFYIQNPTEIKEVKVNNVIGILEGKDKSLPPLILSFHFDHVGADYDKTVYPGALDNASGTSFVMECARLLKTYTRSRDIILAGFNAEEEGLIGSRYFVLNPPLNINNSDCINFDMVGSKREVPLTIMTSINENKYSSKLMKLINSSSTNIEYEENSDHASFNQFGINSVTLINDDENKIHTPEDTIANINFSKFSKLFKQLLPFLQSEGIKK